MLIIMKMILIIKIKLPRYEDVGGQSGFSDQLNLENSSFFISSTLPSNI